MSRKPPIKIILEPKELMPPNGPKSPRPNSDKNEYKLYEKTGGSRRRKITHRRNKRHRNSTRRRHRKH